MSKFYLYLLLLSARTIWKKSSAEKAEECKTDSPGTEYRGFKTETRSGIVCQEWSSHNPHTHYRVTESRYPDSGLQDNYCRNPTNQPEGPWCYTTHPEKRWQYCDVAYCSSVGNWTDDIFQYGETDRELLIECKRDISDNKREIDNLKKDLDQLIKQLSHIPPGQKGESGAMGPPGLPGEYGPIGPMGPSGLSGSKGDSGQIGPIGPMGPSGLLGSKGESGQIGKKGTQGDLGTKGSSGQNGMAGANGPTGPMGPKGPPGSKGESGRKGATGDAGPAGPRGSKGLQGSTGHKGASGPAGLAGAAGPNGSPGPMGPKGESGSNGASGAAGARGPKGAKGQPGSNGYKGSKGQKGSTGQTGPRGPPGPKGAPNSILIQKHDFTIQKSSDPFSTSRWRHYKNGFGDPNGRNYWLGLENMYRLTNMQCYNLEIELKWDKQWQKAGGSSTDSRRGTWGKGIWKNFRVGSESTSYQLTIGERMFTENMAGRDPFRFSRPLNGKKFTTYDADHDSHPNNCAQLIGGGWWMKNCAYVCLNCPREGGSSSIEIWYDGTWRMPAESLMYIRKC